MAEDPNCIPVPAEITLDRTRRLLTVRFEDGARHVLTAEYLRVHSPSAEVRGHGRGDGVLVTGKQDVTIRDIHPVGNYAVRLVFDDGHDTGLYTWKLFHELGRDLDENLRIYQNRLAAAGDEAAQAAARTGSGCGGGVRLPRS